MNKDTSSSRFYLNPKKSNRDYPSFLNEFLSMKDAEEAYNEITKWQKYTPTSLVPPIETSLTKFTVPPTERTLSDAFNVAIVVTPAN